jgi:hypothetical protein
MSVTMVYNYSETSTVQTHVNPTNQKSELTYSTTKIFGSSKKITNLI